MSPYRPEPCYAVNEIEIEEEGHSYQYWMGTSLDAIAARCREQAEEMDGVMATTAARPLETGLPGLLARIYSDGHPVIVADSFQAYFAENHDAVLLYCTRTDPFPSPGL